ncbi:hypothetical protein [Hoylesella oralis]|nr:hypothetical protein [Hoylesella oralis]
MAYLYQTVFITVLCIQFIADTPHAYFKLAFLFSDTFGIPTNSPRPLQHG